MATINCDTIEFEQTADTRVTDGDTSTSLTCEADEQARLRREMYERIAHGNAMSEIEDGLRRRGR